MNVVDRSETLSESTERKLIRIIGSDKNWIDGEAVRQLHETAKRPEISSAVGLPDLHPGKGRPIGAAFLSSGVFFPDLVGNDLGCGIGLWHTTLRRNKVKLERWSKKLTGLEGPWDGDREAWLKQYGLNSTGYDRGLGTIGGGNHFAELQIIEHVEDEDSLQILGLDRECLVLLIHSGSRSLGEAIWNDQVACHHTQGLHEISEEAGNYICEHNRAVKWAESNRALIARRFLSCLGAEGDRILDLAHNTVTRTVLGDHEYWLHRKGAAPSDQGPLIIPGSRGALSYVVAPAGNQESNLFSLPHGAGRKWSRTQSRDKLSARYTPESLTRTDLGSRVICEDKDLIYQEAPQAYKKIEVVIKDLLDAGLIKIIAILRPLITYKTRRTA